MYLAFSENFVKIVLIAIVFLKSFVKSSNERYRNLLRKSQCGKILWNEITQKKKKNREINSLVKSST